MIIDIWINMEAFSSQKILFGAIKILDLNHIDNDQTLKLYDVDISHWQFNTLNS